MSPRKSRGKNVIFSSVILQSILFFGVNNQTAVFAHKVQTAAEVGATLHIEPNDTPRAGEPSQAWFALTRRGGKTIPLAECDCKLFVYAEPHAPGEPALLEPPLQPINAERYQDIPGAKINFPRPGNYQLQLKGKPATAAKFQPFELKFNVTVAVGNTNTLGSQTNQNVTQNTVNEKTQVLSPWIVGLLAVVGVGLLGLLAFVVQRLSKR